MILYNKNNYSFRLRIFYCIKSDKLSAENPLPKFKTLPWIHPSFHTSLVYAFWVTNFLPVKIQLQNIKNYSAKHIMSPNFILLPKSHQTYSHIKTQALTQDSLHKAFPKSYCRRSEERHMKIMKKWSRPFHNPEKQRFTHHLCTKC